MLIGNTLCMVWSNVIRCSPSTTGKTIQISEHSHSCNTHWAQNLYVNIMLKNFHIETHSLKYYSTIQCLLRLCLPHGTVKWSIPKIVGTRASKNKVYDCKKPYLRTFIKEPIKTALRNICFFFRNCYMYPSVR
jgi:hypothetical protein